MWKNGVALTALDGQYAYFLLHTQVTIIVKFPYINKRKKLYALSSMGNC